MTVTVANLPYSFCPTSSSQSNRGFMFKNAYDAWFYKNSTAVAIQITDIDYPGYHTYSATLASAAIKSVTSINRTGSVATVVCTGHGLVSNDYAVISGATQTEYNGNHLVTLVDANTFTYVVTGTPATPATGTITSQNALVTATVAAGHGLSTLDSVTIAGATPATYNGTFTVQSAPSGTTFTYYFTGGTSPATGTITAVGGAVTVPGIVFLDGYFIVMDTMATIYTSAINDAMSWNALDFITAQVEPGSGKAIAKSQNYVIAFKEWSTEFFYDAGNPTGSPLSPVANGFNLIGCASGDSVATLDGMLFWVSQTRQKGRGVHVMQGLQEQQISTPDIERILNLSTLATVYSFGVKIAGHAFYVLTLVDQDITLVYDMTSKSWSEWSSLTLGTPVNVTSIALSDTTATVTTAAAHNLLDGDPVLISGAVQSAYNGIKVISYVDATHYTFQTTAGTTTPATGTITSTPYTETYFKYTKYIHSLGKDLVQHETNGTLAELVETSYQDVGIPVNVVIRTGKFDGGTMDLKRFASVELIGNKVAGTAYVRFSDDDYTTNSKYRPVSLSLSRSIIRRCGSARRRSYELRYLDATSMQLSAIELNVV